MLQARNIVKSYGDLKVLKGIDLRVETGEVISVVGASGAGKSDGRRSLLLDVCDDATEVGRGGLPILFWACRQQQQKHGQTSRQPPNPKQQIQGAWPDCDEPAT